MYAIRSYYVTDDPIRAATFIMKFHKDSVRSIGERRKTGLPPPEDPPTL